MYTGLGGQALPHPGYHPVGGKGAPHTSHTITHITKRCEYERWPSASAADVELQRILAKGTDLMIDGSLCDLLLRSADRG